MRIQIGVTATLVVCVTLCTLSLAQTPTPVFRSQAQVVLVPTLVKTKSGDLVYGLSAKDFIVTDNGVEQEIRIDEPPEVEPISLVVVIQVGRSAPLQFKGRDDPSLSDAERKDCRLKRYPCPTTISELGTMLEAFIGGSKGELAVVTFDSQVRLFQDFTNNFDPLSRRLKLLSPGDDGAAILDAVRFSLEMLEKRPKNQKHVLLLISESRDHGSYMATLADIAQRLTLSNTIVYSASFSPSRGQFFRDLRGDNPKAGYTDLLAPIRSSVQAMRKNVALALAEISGGEYQTFENKRIFDNSLATVANHARNYYQLSFQPKSAQPGPHTIAVRLRGARPDTVVVSRNSYWAVTGSIEGR